MLLAIDVGNTNITFGLFKGSRLIKKFALPTATYGVGLKNKINPQQIENAIIASVVPKATRILEKNLKVLLRKRPIIVGRDIIVPIKNLYRKPKQVGQDRLVNAYAASSFYGAPLVIVDFGTAITFDLISKNREYLGGIIVAGMSLSLKALNEHTALLPKIRLSRPKELIGRDTASSMLSGIVHGSASLTDGLINKLQAKLGKRAKIIGTGGNIGLIGPYCRKIAIKDPDLTLEGLRLLCDLVKNA